MAHAPALRQESVVTSSISAPQSAPQADLQRIRAERLPFVDDVVDALWDLLQPYQSYDVHEFGALAARPADGPWFWPDLKLTKQLLRQNFLGELPNGWRGLGLNFIDPADNAVEISAFDIDNKSFEKKKDGTEHTPEEREQIAAKARSTFIGIVNRLHAIGHTPITASSSGGHGYHIFNGYSGKVPARVPRLFSRQILEETKSPLGTEIFPKNDARGQKGAGSKKNCMGSQIAIPGSAHFALKGGGILIDPFTLEPIPFSRWAEVLRALRRILVENLRAADRERCARDPATVSWFDGPTPEQRAAEQKKREERLAASVAVLGFDPSEKGKLLNEIQKWVARQEVPSENRVRRLFYLACRIAEQVRLDAPAITELVRPWAENCGHPEWQRHLESQGGVGARAIVAVENGDKGIGYFSRSLDNALRRAAGLPVNPIFDVDSPRSERLSAAYRVVYKESAAKAQEHDERMRRGYEAALKEYEAKKAAGEKAKKPKAPKRTGKLLRFVSYCGQMSNNYDCAGCEKRDRIVYVKCGRLSCVVCEKARIQLATEIFARTLGEARVLAVTITLKEETLAFAQRVRKGTKKFLSKELRTGLVFFMAPGRILLLWRARDDDLGVPFDEAKTELESVQGKLEILEGGPKIAALVSEVLLRRVETVRAMLDANGSDALARWDWLKSAVSYSGHRLAKKLFGWPTKEVLQQEKKARAAQRLLDEGRQEGLSLCCGAPLSQTVIDSLTGHVLLTRDPGSKNFTFEEMVAAIQAGKIERTTPRRPAGPQKVAPPGKFYVPFGCTRRTPAKAPG